jgi:hypothetical protein
MSYFDLIMKKIPTFSEQDVSSYHNDYENLFRGFVDRELWEHFGQEKIDHFYATFLTGQASYHN